MSGTLRWARLGRRCPVAAALVAVPLVASTALAGGPPVPWLAEHPTRAPSNPPLAPPCRASDLHGELFLQGATGSLVGGVSLRNVGTRSCSLLGRPTVSLIGPAATVGRWQVKELSASPAPPDVLADPPGSLRALQPGKSASVELFWSNWCGPGSTPTGSPGALPDALALGFASRTTLTIPLREAPRCDAPQYPSTLSIAPYTPSERHLPASSRLPLRVAIVGSRPLKLKPGLRAFRVHRGQLFRYEVAVTNTGAKAFRFASSSCPTFIEQLDVHAGQVWVLNCRPVAAIAPEQTVVFAMQIAIPATARLGNNSLTWQLAPKTYLAPFAAAALWIVP